MQAGDDFPGFETDGYAFVDALMTEVNQVGFYQVADVLEIVHRGHQVNESDCLAFREFLLAQLTKVLDDKAVQGIHLVVDNRNFTQCSPVAAKNGRHDSL